MASNDDFVSFPRGQVGFGSGDLQQCTDAKFRFENGAKVVGTLRGRTGTTTGLRKGTCSFNTIIDETGPERDWIALVKNGKAQQARFKFPGGVTYTFKAVAASVDGEVTLEDGTHLNIELVGTIKG